MRHLYLLGLIFVLPLAGCNDNASTTASTQPIRTTDMTIASTTSTRPDNTGINQRDRDGQNLTAADQSNDPQDLEITRQIRAAVVDDKTLSTNAHNIKIITSKAAVTLRGPVKDAAERDNIAAKAKAVDKVASVDNQLEIQP